MIQHPNPYVNQALDSLREHLGGGWFDKKEPEILPILERLADDSYNEGLEAERRPL